jgi:hypothetical protein
MQRSERTFLAFQLGLGLLWLWLLPLISDPPLQPTFRIDQVRWMLLWAAWCPGIPMAIWQARAGRRWRALLLRDLFFSGGLVLLSCTAYLPLFFTQVPWFWSYALPPRGLIAALGVWLILRVHE